MIKIRNKFKLNIRRRLIVGFAMLVLALAAAVSTTIWKVNKLGVGVDRIVDLRVPTVFSSSQLVNNINASLATLRGWMLTGDPEFKSERAAVWRKIHDVEREMDRLSADWTNPENVVKWVEFKTILDEFQAAQDRVESIAHTLDEQPASKILFTEAVPLGDIMIEKITALIDEEQTLAATPERKELLGIMADIRGTTGMALANVRAYLLSGDVGFTRKFDTFWTKNERRFGKLRNTAHLLTDTQRAALEDFSKARAEFVPLPPEMFQIRGSEKWNMANYLLVSEAATRAAKLLAILIGAKQEDGSRAGGMVENQERLLADDAVRLADDTQTLTVIDWGLLFAGLVIAAVITFLTARSLVNPIKGMTLAMGRLAEGDNTIDVPALERMDEIGEMAQAVQVFKDNAIKLEQLQKKQEEVQVALATKAATLEGTFNNIDQGICMVDADLKLAAFNQRFLDLLDIPHERIRVGDPIEATIRYNAERGEYGPGDIEELIRERFEFARRFEPHRFEHTRHDGTVIEICGNPLTGGGYVRTYTDITERKVAEEALRESEMRFRDFAEAANDWVWEMDADLRFVYMSPSYMQHSGVTPEDVIGRTRPELYAEVLPTFDEYEINKWHGFNQLLNDRQSFRNIELKWVRPDGQIRHFLTSAKPIYDAQGRFAGYRGVGSDITDAKRQEERLGQERRTEAIGTLAAGIAHDFNNILSVMVGHSHLALDALPRRSGAREDIQEIIACIDRATSLVEQILTFSRRREDDSKPIELSEVVADALNFVRASIPSTIAINGKIDGQQRFILADPTQIYQVLINLCVNAADAIGENGGVIHITLNVENLGTAGAPASLSARPDGYLKLVVSDTGDGMDKATAERIFEPFFTTKEAGKGTGLGLAVVHGIVSKYGGAIEVDSKPGHGTTFTIFFPCIGEAEVGEMALPEEMPSGEERVLLVDDEEAIVGTQGRFLEKLGYTVETFTSSAAALEVVRAAPQRFDIVVTDEVMPKLTGTALAREFLKVRSDIPVVLCSGYAREPAAGEGEAPNVREFIKKPVRLDHLARTIRRVLDQNTERTVIADGTHSGR